MSTINHRSIRAKQIRNTTAQANMTKQLAKQVSDLEQRLIALEEDRIVRALILDTGQDRLVIERIRAAQ
jgi:hypothetical protein